jgi:DNA/RNA-binding domain of Phe-tRNA-synthetase-like protein
MRHPLTLSIETQLLRQFPALRLGGFVAHLDRMRGSSPALDVMRFKRTVALRRFVPLGGYDVDEMPGGAIVMRRARPRTDWFVPLGARPTDLPLRDDVIVLAAGSTVLGWGLTLRESRQMCLCPRTRRAAFVSDTVADAQAETASDALEDLRRLLRDAGAYVGPAVYVDARRPIAELL